MAMEMSDLLLCDGKSSGQWAYDIGKVNLNLSYMHVG